MLKNVEARGCSFQWINKPFKVLFIYLWACLFCPSALCWVPSCIKLDFLLCNWTHSKLFLLWCFCFDCRWHWKTNE
jgi:hypothetical protein